VDSPQRSRRTGKSAIGPKNHPSPPRIRDSRGKGFFRIVFGRRSTIRNARRHPVATARLAPRPIITIRSCDARAMIARDHMIVGRKRKEPVVTHRLFASSIEGKD